MQHPLIRALAAPLAVLLVACSSDARNGMADGAEKGRSEAGAGVDAVADAEVDAGASTGTGAPDASACPATPWPPPTATQPFQSLSAKLVDQAGAVVADAPLTVCGFDLCLTGQLDATGAAQVENPLSGHPMLAPALKLGDGLTYAELAYPLPDQPVLDVGTSVAIRLPDFAQSAPLAAGASATTADVTLTLAPGAAITFDEITYLPGQRGLRVAAIPLAHPPLAVAPGEGIEMAYAMAPQGTAFCPPASLDLPNSLAWPAATAVEILVHGVDLAQAWAPYGGWAVVATGSVSADGTRIRTAPGSGLPVLSAIGVRRK